jgi:hypothetical protein
MTAPKATVPPQIKRLTTSKCAISSTQIVSAERRLGVSFSKEYREFLGEVAPCMFENENGFAPAEPVPFANADGRVSIDVLYGLSDNDNLDLTAVNLRRVGEHPTGFISIGHDPGANSILMNNLGQIFIQENDTGKLFFVAKTFKEFLGSFA